VRGERSKAASRCRRCACVDATTSGWLTLGRREVINRLGDQNSHGTSKKGTARLVCSLLSLPVFPPDSGQSLPRQPSRCPFNDRSFESEFSNVYARLWSGGVGRRLAVQYGWLARDEFFFRTSSGPRRWRLYGSEWLKMDRSGGVLMSSTNRFRICLARFFRFAVTWDCDDEGSRFRSLR
jgi:hypothetical protein